MEEKDPRGDAVTPPQEMRRKEATKVHTNHKLIAFLVSEEINLFQIALDSSFLPDNSVRCCLIVFMLINITVPEGETGTQRGLGVERALDP